MILNVTDFLTTSVVLPLVALSIVCYHRGFSPAASVDVPIPIKGNPPTRNFKEEGYGGGDTRALNSDAQRAPPPAYAVSPDPSTMSIGGQENKEGHLAYSRQACTQGYTSDDVDEAVVLIPIPATIDPEKNILFTLSPPSPILSHKPIFLVDPEMTLTVQPKSEVNNRVSGITRTPPDIPSPPEYRPLRHQRSSPLEIRVRPLRQRASFYDTSKTLQRKPQGNLVSINPESEPADEDGIEILETMINTFAYSEMLLDISLPPPYHKTSDYETEMWALTNEMVGFWEARKKKEKKLRVSSSQLQEPDPRLIKN